jgi:hypothetical protein
MPDMLKGSLKVGAEESCESERPCQARGMTKGGFSVTHTFTVLGPAGPGAAAGGPWRRPGGGPRRGPWRRPRERPCWPWGGHWRPRGRPWQLSGAALEQCQRNEREQRTPHVLELCKVASNCGATSPQPAASCVGRGCGGAGGAAARTAARQSHGNYWGHVFSWDGKYGIRDNYKLIISVFAAWRL